MPWKLIIFLLIMVFFVVFAGFNLDNKTTISFGFTSIQDVPIFISLFFAFLLGILSWIPISLIQRKRLKRKYSQTIEDQSLSSEDNDSV